MGNPGDGRLWTRLGLGWDWGNIWSHWGRGVLEKLMVPGHANRRGGGRAGEDVQELGMKAKSEGLRSWGLEREGSWPKETRLSVRHTLALGYPSNGKDLPGKLLKRDEG